MDVTIMKILTGAAADFIGVRIDLNGEAYILLDPKLPDEEVAELLGELLDPDDRIIYASVPEQHVSPDAPASLAS